MYIRKLLALWLFAAILPFSGFTQLLDFEKDFFNHYPQEIIGSEFRTPMSPNTGNYDVIYAKIELNVDPNVYFIDGTTTTRFVPKQDAINQLYFDFSSDIDVMDVRYNGLSINYEQLNGDELRVDFPEDLPAGQEDEVVVQYSGQPSSSGFGSFAVDMQCDDEVPAMWTLSEPYGAKHWWPCKQTLNDKYDSLDMIITTPELYRAGSNGLLVNEIQNNDGTKTYHWSHRYAIPAYLVAFAVSEYEVYSDWVPLENGDQLEILNYIFPCNLTYAQDRTPRTIPIMQFFREKFGEYPYINEKYGHCNFGWGGGMEHSTMSFMGGFSHGLIAHELAHQWFGDKITCGSWQDIWLNEGFATYLEGLTYDFGADPNAWESWKQYNQYRATNSNGSVYVDDTTSVNRIFSGSLSYAKGAYLLHMLRWKMGDDMFFEAINNYIHDPELAYGYAKTPDLQKHLEEVSSMDLDEFFNDWLYGRGFPNYELVWERTDDGVWLKLNQTPSDPSVEFFNIPVPIQINGFSMDTMVVIDPTYSGQFFEIKLPFVPTDVAFDPDKWLCAKNEVFTTVPGIFNDEIRVYPNPVKDKLFVDSGDYNVSSIQVFDNLGRLLIDQQNKKSDQKTTTLDMSGLDAGIYQLIFNKEGTNRSTPIVVE